MLVSILAAAAAAPATSLNGSHALAWKLASFPNDVTESIGVAFTTNTEGYLVGGGNGVGPEILVSNDGGATFTVIPGVNFGIDLLLLAAAAAKNTVIVTSVFGELYSLDGGKTFKLSLGGGTSQSVRYIGQLDNGDGLHFGIAGQHKNAQGVAVTTNGGITFTSYDAKLTTLARYSAYPSLSTWYVSAGDWPPSPPPPASNANAKKSFRARKYELQNEDGTWNTQARPVRSVDDGYSAQISKTTDGGRTWTSLFNENGSFYFNEIDCWDVNTCCAAAESAGSSAPGVRIYCTKDGKTWTKNFEQDSTPGKADYTMLALEFVSATEAWACGGSISLFAKPLFWHTTDSGATWTQTAGEVSIDGSICLGIDMKSPTLGYAAVDNIVKQQAGVAKYSSDPVPPPPPPPPPSPPAPPGTSYGKPPCPASEQAVQINGVTGSYCAPSCSKTQACPAPAAGVGATGQCVVEQQGSTDPTLCALICVPGKAGECPAGASCQAIQGTGICTFPAAPASAMLAAFLKL